MFVHLHCHSHFSFGAGTSSPEALVAAAAERGFTALACTDTNGVYGAVEFQQAALEAGVRPILGAHLEHEGQECVVLALDEIGWGALCRAVTGIQWAQAGRQVEQQDRTLASGPPFPIGKGDRGLGRREGGKAGRREVEQPAPFALSAQMATDRAGLAVLSRDISFLERVVKLSGPDGIYAELVPGKERHAVLAAARRLGIPVVATNAVMMAHPEEWSRHRLLRAISSNTAVTAVTAATAPRDAWLRPEPDLARFFPDAPEALTNAARIADRCRYRIPIGRIVPPRLAADQDAHAQLRSLTYEGALRRYGTVAPLVRDRIEHELRIIGMKGFADYFLVVRDIIQHGPTHCGRGSVANSVVSYCLGITHVEPLGAGLLFERFLNPERKDPPDIDLDFPWDERDKVLAYVFQRYPRPRAAMVANHNCFRLRGALREVAKVHGRPPGEIREVTRRIPWYSDDESLGDLLMKHPNYRGLDLPEVWRDLARMAEPLVGIPRHLSLHPGGVVIVPGTLTDYVPLEPAVKTLDGFPDVTVPVIQFEKDGAEDAGLVKIDLLGNRSLAVIRDAIAMVKENTGKEIDYTRGDAGDDPATRALFRQGKTMGVFYTESPASRLLCQKSKAETFDLLVLNTSIIRPASNRFIRVYLERLHGSPWEPLDLCLRDVLSDTFGVMVYQEDVVNVCAVFAGMPLATGDGLRKALSKKRPVKQLAAYAGEFFAGAEALGRNPETAAKVWEMIMSFAGYSFCKGHSCSYIQVAQQSCYLRANHPAEFFAAVLSNGGGFYHPFAYIAEAMREGITILPPDVNESQERCTGRGRELRVGLQFVKGLGAEARERIVGGRQDGPKGLPRGLIRGPLGRQTAGRQVGRQDGRTVRRQEEHPYASLADFRSRTRIADDDLRILIKVGALDSIANGLTRPMMLWAVDSIGAKSDQDGQLSLGSDHLPPCRPAALPPLKEYTEPRKRREQYELLEFNTDVHPMSLHSDTIRRLRLVKSSDLCRHVGESVLVAGMLTTSKPVHTVKDEPMEFATFDDGHGLIETVLFPGVYRARGHVLFDQGPFLLRGKVEEEFGAVTLTVTHLERLERVT